MASLEQLEIHSRSFLIRYVTVASEHSIYWSIQPHKKSINFGIFKHTKALSGVHQTESSLHPPDDPSASPPPSKRPGTSRGGRSNDNSLFDKLNSAGMQHAYWHGKVEAEKVTKGQFDVPKGQGGVYALVFDNTFSKQVSKTITFVVLTYPTNQPPPASHQIQHHDASPVIANTATMGGHSPKIAAMKANSQHNKSMESLGLEMDGASMKSQPGFYNGILKKRKRKRHQGFARRFFSLDFTSSTLSYYLDRDSTALRGAIPLGLAAISASKAHYEIWVDSGAEVWHLRAANQAEWEGWKNALERAANKAGQATHEHVGDSAQQATTSPNYAAQWAADDRGWQEVEALLGRLSGIRDATRRLSSACQRNDNNNAFPGSSGLGFTASASGPTSGGTTPVNEARRPFWKRKASGNSTHGSTSPSQGLTAPTADGRPRSVSSSMAFNASMAMAMPGTPLIGGGPQYDVTSHVTALLSDLDSLVGDFSRLVNDNKHRRWLHHRSIQGGGAEPLSAASRVSMDSMSDQEFYDADEMDENNHVMIVENDSEGHTDFHTDDDASSDSGDNDAYDHSKRESSSTSAGAAPQREMDLSPLPLDKVKRRNTVGGSSVLPPSLIGFLRKNVGKDLSTIAMPVSANEPLNLLQRVAEQLEYCELLDQAAKVPAETGERLLYIAAFAVSAFSNCRAKERAIRKPFNPLLGETYELVREDKGFRFLAEKVCHRPVIMASQADSANWTFTQSPMPTQKFWGKSAELNTSGRVRISLHSTGDNYSWTCATSFLRNIIAGEKYVEPVGTMTIHHENTGDRAVVTFKAKGMFSGRSEDVGIEVVDAQGNSKGRTLSGKWTTSLAMFDEHETMIGTIWSVGKLVDNPALKYGFTEFAASLNEMTSIEEGKVAITDARLRPDQRMCEDGQLDEAEDMKLKLEEKQRQRRKVAEETGKPHVPRWFVKEKEYADEEVWKMKSGKDGYWTRRKKGDWGSDAVDLFT